jgi:hypothetical protein
MAWAIAIPARNDADRIAACLAAVARQQGVAMADGAVVVFASNCNDDTPRIARESKQGCALHVVQQNSASGAGSTGEARRLAMAHARRLLREDGILLTTDANVTVDSDWLAAMISCFADRRVDAVVGAISPFREENALELSIGALERRYWDLIVAAEDAIDPQPHDPAPRHGRESGSNFGIRATMLDAVDGVPAMARGEIRALADAVRARDGGIRHANAPHATATAPPHHSLVDESMATAPRDPVKSRIWWPAATVEWRLTLRKAARIAYARGEFSAWAADHGVRDFPAQAHFGSSWAGYLARSPGLAPTPVDRAALPAQIAMLEYLLAQGVDRG